MNLKNNYLFKKLLSGSIKTVRNIHNVAFFKNNKEKHLCNKNLDEKKPICNIYLIL